MHSDENKPANQSSNILSSKRKRDFEESRSKVSRSEGFSWWTSLMLGVEPRTFPNWLVVRLCPRNKKLMNKTIRETFPPKSKYRNLSTLVFCKIRVHERLTVGRRREMSCSVIVIGRSSADCGLHWSALYSLTSSGKRNCLFTCVGNQPLVFGESFYAQFLVWFRSLSITNYGALLSFHMTFSVVHLTSWSHEWDNKNSLKTQSSLCDDLLYRWKGCLWKHLFRREMLRIEMIG